MSIPQKPETVIHVNKAEHIPTVEHWAIIRNTSVFIPDEGVWAPGHGYPAHTDNYITYVAYLDRAEFEEAVASSARNRLRETFRVMHVMPLKVETTVTVAVKS
jgi:hypothetical protein